MKLPKNAQWLLLPLSSAQVLAGYRNEVYCAYFGRENYGLDLTDRTDPCVYAGGKGVVLASGYDDSLGNTVIVSYNNVFNHKTQEVADVVVRYCYLSAITTAPGCPVCEGDLLGLMGSTALADRGILLYMEIDSDITHPTQTPSLLSEGRLLRPGCRNPLTTIDPSEILHVGYKQNISVLVPDWCDVAAFDLPVVPRHEPGSSLSVFEKFESALMQNA